VNIWYVTCQEAFTVTARQARQVHRGQDWFEQLDVAVVSRSYSALTCR
jgi:hypothetical protein